MSLRERVLIILCVMFGCYLALEYSVHRWLIYPEYVMQEQQQAQNAVEYAVEVIQNAARQTQEKVARAAKSGAFYEMLKNPQTTPAVNSLNCDFLLVYDHQFNPVWNDQADSETRTVIQHDLLETETPFITVNKMGFSKNGLHPVNGRYARVIVEPILSSPQSLTVEGMVIVGYYLNDTHFQDLKDRLGLTFNWKILSPEEMNNATAEIAQSVTVENPYHFSTLGDNLLQCGTFLYDVYNRPALLVKTFQDRQLSTHGLQTIHKLLMVKAAAGLVAVIFLTLLLQRLVITPILKLIKHIGKSGSPTSKEGNLNFARNDEIGTLACEFDNMRNRVQNAQVKLAEKSYYSGITEMSSGILHNVRNALSPITTRIDRIKDQFRDIPLQHLEQAQQELQNGSLSHERRTDLIRFVELTFQNVVLNLKETVTGLEELSLQVFQIEDMLNSQKTFGGRDKNGPFEFVEPIQLIDKALEMVPDRTFKYCKVKTQQIKKVPAIPVHTTTFPQVLQNLIINAAEAIEREKSLYSKIVISCESEPGESVDMLHWTIEDNGAGIEPEKIKTIFERGASSKNKGLTGIGLHWCANTVTAMRGKIWAESNGPHRGACFHILIPMAAEETLAATAEEG